jgi:hypothetical protein
MQHENSGFSVRNMKPAQATYSIHTALCPGRGKRNSECYHLNSSRFYGRKSPSTGIDCIET